MSTAAKISIQIDAQTATLQKGFGEAKAAINNLGASMSGSVAMGMAKFNLGLAAVKGALATVQGAINAVMGAMDDMGKMDEFATRLGMSADSLTVLGYAAEQTGASQETMNASLQKMQNLIGEAAAGSKTAAQAFDQIGLSVGQLMEMTPDEQFTAIADKIQDVGSASQRTKIALDIFGKSGGELINLLAGGSEGLDVFGKEAEQIGLLMGNARSDVEAAGDSINKMKRAWGAFVQQVAIAVAPALATIAEELATIIGSFNEIMGIHSVKIVGSTKVLAKKAARAAAEEMEQLTKSAERAATKIKDVFKDIPKPADWTTPGIGAATRGSAAGFSAVQEANRAKQDADRRHRELIAWQARIERAVLASAIRVVPLSF